MSKPVPSDATTFAHPDMIRDRLALAAVALVVVGFATACLHGIANAWQWGHDGFNGAAFWLAARNSLRFGLIAPAPYYTGLEAPGAGDLVVHHPMLLHLHLCVAQAIGGDAEWVGRLVPAAYSIALLVLVAVVATRLADRATGVAAATIFALLPINTIYANMIDHEQGASFWCLAFLWSFERWRAGGGRRALLWTLGCATMALQFDWVGSYIAFFVAARALEGAGGAGVAPAQRRAGYMFVAALTLVVVLNLGGHLLFVAGLGLARDVGGAFWSRSAMAPAGYLAVEARRVLDLFGVLPAGLLIAWVIHAVLRLRDGTPSALNAVAAAFVYAQVIHGLFFSSAVYIHAYLLYSLGVAAALGGGVALVAIIRRGLAWAGSRTPARVAVIGVVVAAAAWQGAFAFRQLRWGYATGRASYMGGYDDQLAELAWAREVARIFPRPGAAFAVDASVRRRRIEFDSYLDGPIRVAVDEARAFPGLAHEVVLLDRDHLPQDRREAWARVADRYASVSWDDRFVAIDLADASPGERRFRSRLEPAPWWWRWLVHADRPPQVWIETGGGTATQRHTPGER